MRKVQVFIFDEAEVMDVAGPYEVFSVAGRRHGLEPFEVSLVAERPGLVSLRNGFRVEPHMTIAKAPQPHLLVIPGGFGTRREMHNPAVLDWIRGLAPKVEMLLSVCTGALVLASAGLLDGLQVTTHHGALDLLRQTAPTARVREAVRFLDNGKVVVSAGISAGIDMSLHVVERLLGEEMAEETATYMEYHWDRNASGLQDLGM
jgi:transcriptional regulator GlxA family with amidase domain